MASCELPKASFCGNNSVVECNLAKVEVVSSNLISRSKNGDCGSVLRGRFSLGGWVRRPAAVTRFRGERYRSSGFDVGVTPSKRTPSPINRTRPATRFTPYSS